MDTPTTSTSSSSAVAVADGASAAASSKTTAAPAMTATAATANKNVTSVTLLIKASNQLYDDQIVESDLLWTVHRLKLQLSLVYPSKPPVAEQKLIYSGQLLNDKLLLKDVIRSYKDVYTHNHIIHLVYTPPSARYPQLASAKINRPSNTTNNTNTTMNANTTSTTTDGLRQRYPYSGTQQRYTQPNTPATNSQQQSQQPQVRQPQAQVLQQQPQVRQPQPQVRQPQPQVRQPLPQVRQPQAQAQAQPQTQTQQQARQQQLPPFYTNPAQFIPQMMPANLNAQRCPQFDPNNPFNPLFNMVSPWNMQVLATQQIAMYNWMQQVYNQYMDRYTQYCNAAAGNGIGAAISPTIMAQSNNSFPFNLYQNDGMPLLQTISPLNIRANLAQAQMQQSAENVVTSEPSVQQPQTAQPAQQPEVPPQPQPQPQMEAPRFPNIVQEEPENRDWLDRFFSITRLALFLTILYFNSSPLRCLAVILIAGAIYLNHIGVFRAERNNNNINRNNNDQIRQGVQQVQRAQAQAAQERQQDNPQNFDSSDEEGNNSDDDEDYQNGGEANTAAAAGAETEAADAEDEANEPGIHNVGAVAFVRTFVITFFSSLLPETPAAL